MTREWEREGRGRGEGWGWVSGERSVGATKIYLSVNLYTSAIFKMSNHPKDPLLFLVAYSPSRVCPYHHPSMHRWVCFHSVFTRIHACSYHLIISGSVSLFYCLFGAFWLLHPDTCIYIMDLTKNRHFPDDRFVKKTTPLRNNKWKHQSVWLILKHHLAFRWMASAWIWDRGSRQNGMLVQHHSPIKLDEWFD